MDDEDKQRLNEQERNAESLRQQIKEVVSGQPPATRRKSLRDFIEEKMAEDRQESQKN